MVAFSCITVMILSAKCWQAAALSSLTITVVVYPVLKILENKSWFAGFFAQKSNGEVVRSLVMLFSMFAFLTFVSWGLFNKKEAGAAAILMWGFGDACAAIVGIPFGKHKVKFRFADGKKSWEGTLAMFVAALLCGLLFLGIYAKLNPTRTLISAVLGAFVGALVELVSPSEYDTVTVPLAILAIMLYF